MRGRPQSEFEQEVSAAADPGSRDDDPQEDIPVGTQWSFELNPYLWVPSKRGSTTVQGNTGPFVLSELAAFVLHSELGIDRFSLFADLNYLDLNESQTTKGERTNVEFKQAIF